MKKSAVTLETIAETLAHMQTKLDSVDSRLGTVESGLGSVNVKLQAVDLRLGFVESNMNDIQSNVEFLVAHAVMKDDVRQIVREEMKPIMAPLYATMDLVIHKHQTFEGEVLAHEYRIGSLERVIGFPNAA